MDRVALPAWEGWELVQLSSGIRVARMALPGIPASAWGSYHRRDTEKPIAAPRTSLVGHPSGSRCFWRANSST